MAKKNWKTERKWDRTKMEISFEKLLEENGYAVVGFKEYVGMTDYLISKNGTEFEWRVYNDKNANAKKTFASFESAFDMKLKLDELKKEYAAKQEV